MLLQPPFGVGRELWHTEECRAYTGGNPECWPGDEDLEQLCRGFVWFGFSAAYLTPTTGEGWREKSSLLQAEQPQVFNSACGEEL